MKNYISHLPFEKKKNSPPIDTYKLEDKASFIDLQQNPQKEEDTASPPLRYKGKRAHRIRGIPFYCTLLYSNYFTLATIALKAAGLFTARSARTLRLISIPALWRLPIN